MRSMSLDIGECYSRCAFVSASDGARFSWIATRLAGNTRAQRESRQQEGRGMLRISHRSFRPAVVASVRWWAARMPAGQAMMPYATEIAAPGPTSFETRLKEPFGPMLLALAAPENPLFIMREKEGLVDPNTQIAEAVGSGPFIF